MPQPISYNQFQKLVCASAQQYYDYLTDRFEHGDRSSGSKIITVNKIYPGTIPGEYTLETNEKVTFPDACQIWIRDHHAPSIRIISVQTEGRYAHAVRVADTQDIISSIPNLTSDEIQIISDLRFLIRRIGEFYERQAFSLLPPAPQNIPELPESLIAGLSDEQRDAIDTALHSPVAYISGAPGTGKTKAVLSRCILRYIFAKKRILLLAPTNNAVEQMLRGVLPILQGAGIDLECVYRLGTATDEFASEYPQVVGDAALEARLRELKNRKEFCGSMILEADSAREKFNLFSSRLQVCREIHEKTKNLLPEADLLRQEYMAAYQEFHATSTEIEVRQLRCDDLRRKIEEISRKTAKLEAGITLINTQIRKYKHWFWLKTKCCDLQHEVDALQVEANASHAAHIETLYEYDCADRDLSFAKEKKNICFATLETISSKRSEVSKHLHRIAEADIEYLQIIEAHMGNLAEVTAASSDFLLRLEAKVQKLAELYESYRYEALIRERDAVNLQLAALNTNTKVSQRENALVLAGTIDSALDILAASNKNGEDLADIRFTVSHVFLDEAGYTCIAKGMTVFACGAPVTFLGDHKQLPPVCEMNNIPSALAPVCLWALPVAYYSELLYGGLEKLFQLCYSQNMEPSFDTFAYFSLNTSYRFGPELASILAKYVYTDRFKGIADTPFSIKVIHAPRYSGPLKNSSRSEGESIASYLRAYPSASDSIAVLAPYRGQTKYLRSIVPRQYRDNILTVHRSQGCEWDTVILSVVDTYQPYFTNSNLSIGRSVLNSAISRAKRQLVIVCDTQVWSNRSKQMITELVNVGERIEN